MPCEQYKDEWSGGLGVAAKPDCSLDVARDAAAWRRSSGTKGPKINDQRNIEYLGVGMDLKDHLVPTPPAIGRDTSH